ncbi:MAG: RsmB/NOP family class I SAM-dependent RNA methyltransferase [Luteolibacter sp.]
MPTKNYHVRQAAVSALHAWSKGHDYAETLVERHAQRRLLKPSDRNLLQAILFAVLRHRRLLDHWIGELRKGKLDPETRDLLRVGLSQILLLGIPDHAAVNETVECGKANVRGLVNAVMRRAIESRERLLQELNDLPPAIRHSHPDWLFKRWSRSFGKAHSLALMQWNNQPAENFIRINPLADWSGDYPGEAVNEAPGFFRVVGAVPADLIAAGAVYVQDPATRHAVALLDPKQGERILDACAAPGGKAFLIAAALGGGVGLTCTDSNEKRLPRLRENLQRLKIQGVSIQQHDWTQPAPQDWHGSYDAILLDVPCSNTGVMRRRVDVRWRLQPQDIAAIACIQREILENALPCLKAGGRIVYSTCSIEDEENGKLVGDFVDSHPECQLISSRDSFPFRDAMDGAYAACIQLRDHG